MEYPDTVLLREWARASYRAERDLFPGCFHFQSIASFQVEFFSQWLGDHNAACFVNDKACIHFGLIRRVEPCINPTLANLVLAHERAGALMQDSCGDLIGPCQNNYGIDFEAIPELKPAMPTLNSSIDFVAYDREGQVVLLAEAKSRRGTSEAWAASLRRNMLAHGVLPWAKYFLIATPERMYLWQQEHPTSPEALPDFTIDAEKVFQPYFQKLTLESSEIGPTAFEHLVLTWLTEIARSDEGKPKQETSSAWLSELSRSLQEARIEMNPMR